MQITVLSRLTHSLSSISTRALFGILLLAIGSIRLSAQVKQVRFVLVNLSEHKPVPNQRLLLYTGSTPQQVRRHLALIRLMTDSRGGTSFEWNPKMHWFQVWIDGSSKCLAPPDRRMVFHSSVLFDEGIVVSNTCTPALERLAPDVPILPIVVP
jgi:hypothetical protein